MPKYNRHRTEVTLDRSVLPALLFRTIPVNRAFGGPGCFGSDVLYAFDSGRPAIHKKYGAKLQGSYIECKDFVVFLITPGKWQNLYHCNPTMNGGCYQYTYVSSSSVKRDDLGSDTVPPANKTFLLALRANKSGSFFFLGQLKPRFGFPGYFGAENGVSKWKFDMVDTNASVLPRNVDAMIKMACDRF
jgi:hypothetical protein